MEQQPADNSLETSTTGSVYDSSLEEPQIIQPVEPLPLETRGGGFSPFKFNHMALIVTGASIVAITLIAGGAFLLSGLHKNSNQNNSGSSQKASSFNNSSLSLDQVRSNQSLDLSQAQELAVNGELQVNSGLVLTPGTEPTNPTAGQIYYDQKTSQPYFYNGSKFVPIGQNITKYVSSVGGASGSISVGNGLVLNGNQLSVAASVLNSVSSSGVSSVQGQTGAVSFSAGAGIGISGTTISNTGVTGLNGTANQVNVSGASGNITLSLPQSIGTSSTPTFSGLTFSGTNTVSLLGPSTAPGSNISFHLPNSDGTANECLATDGSGNLSFEACAAGASVSSLNSETGSVTIVGTANQVTVTPSGQNITLSLPQNINSGASPTFAGLTVASGGASITGGLNVTGLATISNGLNVTGGGASITGNSSISGLLGVTGSDVSIGSASQAGELVLNAGNGKTANLVVAGGLGQDSTYTLPDVGGDATICVNMGGTYSCGNGVTSVDNISGALNLANSSGAGSTITIDDASTSAKGIAEFSASDFSVTTGTVSLGTVGVGKGGTGLTSTPTNGQLLIGNGTGYSLGNLSNSDGTVTITNGPGSINISVPRADQCSTCADFTLSNLSDIVAINKSLLPASAGTVNLGGPTVPYQYAYLSGDSLTPGSNNFKITGTSTGGQRLFTLPDASGTACLTTTCIQLQSTSPGAAQTGNINVTGSIIAGTNLTVSGTATINTLAPASATPLVVGATGAGQTTTVQGNSVSFNNGSANYSFNSNSGGPYTLCDSSGNCAGAGGGLLGSGTTNTLPYFSSSNHLSSSIISQDAGATTATIAGNLTVNGTSLTAAGALAVSSTGGSNALTLSSGSGTLVLGGSTATIQRSAASLTLDVSSSANSTLTVTNSNATHVASLSVEGGVNIGSGQTYSINGNDINSSGTLSNVAYLGQANSFTANQSITGTLTVSSTINSQTIGAAANFTGTVAVQGGWNGSSGQSLTLGTSSSKTGSIVFNNLAGSNNVSLRASDTNPTSSFSLTLPSALGSTGDCLEQTSAGGALGFVGCAAGLGGSGTTGTIPLFVGPSAIGDSLLTQSGSVVSIQGSGNDFSVDDTISVGKNGASGIAGKVSLNDGSNPGRTVSLQAQQVGTGYTLQLPTSADVGSTCLVLTNVSAGVDKISGGSCAAGGSGGNITATGTTNGHLTRFTSDGPSYTAVASLVQDNGSGVGVNTVPQASYVLTVGSSNKFNVTDGGQLEIGTTGSNPLTLATNGNITNAAAISASGLISTSKSGTNALLLSGTAPINNASLFQLGPNAISSGSANGTYIGANPTSFSGNFVDYQVNNLSKFKVDASGNVTSGTINGVTIGGTGTLTNGGFTLTLNGNAALNQDVQTTSTVQFATLHLTNALMPQYGGTGNDTSGSLAGAVLAFNATTGKFVANRITSNDNSLTINNSDGQVDLSVASCSACAKTDLSNLAVTTSLNHSLQAQTGVDLGSTSNAFRDLYIYGSSATPASNNFKITGTSTGGQRVITLPDASGTVCLTGTCIQLQASSPGTAQTGNINVTGSIIAGTNFSVAGTATINTLSPASATPLLLGATGASQTTTVQGSSLTLKNGTANYTFNSNSGGPYTICDSTGNCAGAGGGVTTGGGTSGQLAKFSGSSTLTSSIIGDDGSTASVAGNFTVSATGAGGNNISFTNSAINTNNTSLAQFSITNAASSGTININGVTINTTGTATSGANTQNSLFFSNVTGASNNTFNAITVGTGYTNVLKVGGNGIIDGSGILQNVALSSSLTYTNLAKVGNLTATTGTVTLGGASQTGSLVVDSSSGGSVTLTAGAVGSGASYSVTLPTALGTAGQCLSVSSAGSGSESLGYASCASSTKNKALILTPEYAGAVLDAASDASCSSANSGTMTSGYDSSSSRMNYYDWNSTNTSTSQCYDVVVQVELPDDFGSWAASDPINVQVKASNASNASAKIQVIDNANSTDSNYNYAGGSVTTSWSDIATTGLASSNYAKDTYFTIKIRMSSKSSADLQLGNITLNYVSAY